HVQFERRTEASVFVRSRASSDPTSSEGRGDLPVPGRRLSWCHHRFSDVRPEGFRSAKRFFQNALLAPGHPRPRVINVDGNASYPKVVAELKQEGKLGRRCRCRTCPYLNNIVEQDHRAIKRRVNASQGFRSLNGARRTIQGYEVVHMIRKGPGEVVAQRRRTGLILFLNETLGLSAE